MSRTVCTSALLVVIAACGPSPLPELPAQPDAGCAPSVATEPADAGPADAGAPCVTNQKLAMECADAYNRIVDCCNHDVGAGAEAVCEGASDAGTACAVLQIRTCDELADAGWCG